MNKDQKRRISHEGFIFLGSLIALCFVGGIWPAFLLGLLGLSIYAIIKVRLLKKQVDRTPPVSTPVSVLPEPQIETEQDMLKYAYSIIQKRITEKVLSEYPNARWIWEHPNTLQLIINNEPVFILLNRAGGYRKATITIQNLQFVGLSYVDANPPDPVNNNPSEPPEDADRDDEDDDNDADRDPINYELLAFEWVEAHAFDLNRLCNEAFGKGDKTALIPASMLPEQVSWPSICQELARTEFPGAKLTSDGIQVTLPQ